MPVCPVKVDWHEKVDGLKERKSNGLPFLGCGHARASDGRTQIMEERSRLGWVGKAVI